MHEAEKLIPVLQALADGHTSEALGIAEKNFPFKVRAAIHRKQISYTVKLDVYARDKYQCRYFGERLVFPGVLAILQRKLARAFPADPPRWTAAASHPIFWRLSPVVDHRVSIASGIGDVHHLDNLVTTSQYRNTQKMHWSIEDVGWTDRGVSAEDDWDGLVGWFRDYMSKADDDLRADKEIARWHKALTRTGKTT